MHIFLYTYMHIDSHTHFCSLFQFVKQYDWLDHVLLLFSQNAAVAPQANKMIVERQRSLSAGKNLISFSPVVSAQDHARRQSELK